MRNKAINELQSELAEIEKLLKFARLYGSIAIAGKKISIGELEEMRTSLKIEIASIQSKQNLRLIK